MTDKIKILFVALILGVLCASAADISSIEEKSLVLRMTDGTERSYRISSDLCLTYRLADDADGYIMQIYNDSQTIEIPVPDIDLMNVVTTVGVDDVTLPLLPEVFFGPDFIELRDPACKSRHIAVYDLRGRTVLRSTTAPGGSTTTLSTSALMPGTYIITIDSISYKFIKK